MSIDAPWWKSAVVYQIYPRSFADSDGDGIGDLRGHHRPARPPGRRSASTSLWLSPVYPSPQDDNGYDISDYQDIDPLFGTLDDFDELLGGLHDRGHEAGHGPGRQPHLRRAPVVRRVAVVAATTPSATGTGGARRARHAAGAPGAEPTNWGSFFSGPAWEFDEATGEYYLHLFSRKQPDLNWENPEVRAGGLRDDALVARPRRRRLPDGRHQHHLQGRRRCPTAPVPDGSPYGDGSPYFIGGPRIHEFLHEMHREVFAGRDRRLPDRRRDAGRHRRGGARCSPTRPAPRSTWSSSSSTSALDQGRDGKWDVRPLRPAATSRRRSAAGRPAWPTSAGTASTGTTTTSRGSCPASATTASTGCGRPSCSAPCCTCTAARRTSTRARSSA